MAMIDVTKWGWMYLTEPSAVVQDSDERRRVRLFASVQTVLVLALLPMAFHWLPIEKGYENAPFFWQFMAQIAAYVLSRTRFYRAGVIVSLGALLGMGVYSSATTSVFSSASMSLHLMWSVLPLLYGSMIFSQRTMLGLSIVVLGSFSIMPIFIGGMEYIHIAPVAFLVGLWSVAHNLLLGYNALSARERQEVVEETAVQLTQTNALLQAEISERKAVEMRMEASLQEKEILLKEIHHRVKNNLQVVSSLLNLQASYVAGAQNREIFRESQNRVRSMALIHEKLYQSDDLARIDFGDYVRHLARFLFQAYGESSKRIKLSVQADAVFLGVDTAVPIGFILNELISNALKHAFPDNRSGQISIELRQNEKGDIGLRVGDDGVGLPPGMDISQSSSLGLQLVQTLAGQVNGRFHYENQGGAVFTLSCRMAGSEKQYGVIKRPEL